MQRCVVYGIWGDDCCRLILLAAYAVIDQPSSLVLHVHSEFVHLHSSSCSHLAACGLLLSEVMKNGLQDLEVLAA